MSQKFQLSIGLNQNRIIRHEYENSLRKDLLLTKKRQFLVSGVIINDEEVEQAFKRNFEKIELDSLFFDPQFFEVSYPSHASRCDRFPNPRTRAPERAG